MLADDGQPDLQSPSREPVLVTRAYYQQPMPNTSARAPNPTSPSLTHGTKGAHLTLYSGG